MTEPSLHVETASRPKGCLGRAFRAVVALMLLLALALAFYRPVLMRVGRFLVVDEPPVASDVVVVAGGGMDRVAFGLELVKKGIAPKILVIASPQDCPRFWGFKCSDVVRDKLMELGLREDQIIMETRSHSTHTDAVFARQDMEREGITSAVVVSDPFHMRRLSWAWRQVFASSGVRLTFTAVPFEQTIYALDGWWSREAELIFVFNEYAKLAFYWVKGYI